MAVSYRVWCLSWGETEDDAIDVVEDPGSIGRVQLSKGTLTVPKHEFYAQPIVEAYAEHCYYNRDGYKSSWPLTFRLRTPEGTLEDFEVEREYHVELSARRVNL